MIKLLILIFTIYSCEALAQKKNLPKKIRKIIRFFHSKNYVFVYKVGRKYYLIGPKKYAFLKNTSSIKDLTQIKIPLHMIRKNRPGIKRVSALVSKNKKRGRHILAFKGKKVYLIKKNKIQKLSIRSKRSRKKRLRLSAQGLRYNWATFSLSEVYLSTPWGSLLSFEVAYTPGILYRQYGLIAEVGGYYYQDSNAQSHLIYEMLLFFQYDFPLFYLKAGVGQFTLTQISATSSMYTIGAGIVYDFLIFDRLFLKYSVINNTPDAITSIKFGAEINFQ